MTHPTPTCPAPLKMESGFMLQTATVPFKHTLASTEGEHAKLRPPHVPVPTIWQNLAAVQRVIANWPGPGVLLAQAPVGKLWVRLGVPVQSLVE